MRNMCKLLCVLLTSFISQIAYSYSFRANGIYYTINGSSVSVTSGEVKYSGSIVIPSSVSNGGNNYIVSSIGSDAFSQCGSLTSVSIPHSVTSIGSGAFYRCAGLPSLTIPNSVKTIEENAFSRCTGLTSISIPNSVTIIEDGVFYMCSGLNKVTLPNGVTSIGDDVFNGCSNLTSISIPNTVSAIGVNVFKDCTSLSSASISTRMNTIGDDMFSGCSSLTSISIPSSVTKIGSSAFYKCSSLNSITISDNVTTIGENCFSRCSSLTTLKLPNRLTTIEDGLFYECSNLASVSIPTSVTSIGDDVFMGCSNLKSISIPSGVKTIGKNAFSGCNFDYISIMSTVNPVNGSTFDNCKMSALVWAPNVVVPTTAVNSSTGSNFLLYVKNASYAPSSVRNVVINGTAPTITLSDDGGKFYCPESFKAQKISYTHQYSMETGGTGKGWESIALPFDVQKISHATKGEMTPFANYSNSTNKKPFWLYSFSGNGFVKATSIQANKPYIIAMPNQSDYNKEYILTGDVSFSSENVTVSVTSDYGGTFVPTYAPLSKSASISVLNISNRFVRETGGYEAGSRFISNLRDVRPFEGYLKGISSTRSVDDMIGEDYNEE